MKIWKKNLIAAAILVTVCAGIYVNWLYTQEQETADLTQTLNADKLLSTDMLVMSEEPHGTTTLTDYFAAVRLSRQEARDSAVSLLQEAMAYDETAESSQANAQLEEIVQMALCEAQIESLVIAKGYADCVAYIGTDGISVAVATPEGGMQQQDIAVISDIILSQSDFKLSDVHIVEVQ